MSMNTLKTVMSEVLRMREDEITDTLSITDTENWDSLKHMELIVEIEQTFNIELTTDEIVAMVNMGEIRRVLKDKGVNL